MKEELMVVRFKDFLGSIEGKYVNMVITTVVSFKVRNDIHLAYICLCLFVYVDGELLERLEEHTDLTAKQKEFISVLNPGNVLAFATGSSVVPAMGFSPSPKLIFVHDVSKIHPIAHTCAN